MNANVDAIVLGARNRASSKEPVCETSQLPMVSVIVPVRNESNYIRDTLACLLVQDYPLESLEILVIDGESTDNTREIVAACASIYPHVRLLHNPGRLASAGRNIGVKAARGEFVLVVDGHCEIRDCDHLRRLAEAFALSGADCLGRPQPLDVSHASTLQQAIAAARSSRLGHHPDSFIYSAAKRFVPAKSVAAAYRRDVFEQIGLFDEAFDACEDVELNHRIDRAGLRCYFTPDIAVNYIPRGSLLGLFRQMVRYGRGRVRLARKHPETRSLLPFLPALFVAGLILGLPLSFVAWPLAAVYVSILAIYMFVVVVGSVFAAWSSRSLWTLPWLPFVFAAVHIGSGTGLLWELLASALKPKRASDGRML